MLPAPTDVARPLVAAYQQQLKAAGQGLPDYVSLEGWVAGQVIVQALRRVNRLGSRVSFMRALESLGGLDLGGLVLGWDPVRRQALSQASMTVLDASGRALR